MTAYAGLDPSLTGFGVCVLIGDKPLDRIYMKARNKPAIKRNSPQSADDDFTPEQITEWREGVAWRRHELFSMDFVETE